MTSLSVISVLIVDLRSRFRFGVEASGSWSTIECQSQAGGGLLNLVKKPVTKKEVLEEEGCHWRLEWIRRSRFWMKHGRESEDNNEPTNG